MRILIKNAWNTYNYGTMMMAENIITYFNKYLKKDNIEYFFESATTENLDRYKRATLYNKIFSDKLLKVNVLTEKIKYIRHIERKIKTYFNRIKVAKFYDVIIILGGDDFSEIYYEVPRDNCVIRELFKELNTYNKYTKLFMIGQTIGPYTGKRLEWAKQGFKNIEHIYSRDMITQQYMKETFNKDVKASKDLAFLNLNLQKKYEKQAENILKKYNLFKEKYITFVATGLIDIYTKNEKNMIDSVYNLLIELKQKYPEYKIVYLSHVVTPDIDHNDNYIMNKINIEYNNYIKNNCVVINEPILPVEARTVLGNGKYTITFRMHAAVSTFQMGKPAICLAYSKKFKGVIADGLECPELVLDATKKEFFKTEFNNQIFERIDYIEKNAEYLDSKIKKSVMNCKIEVETTIKEIIQIINEGN